MKTLGFLIVAFAVGVSGFAQAGEIRAQGKSFPEVDPEPSLVLSSADLDLKESSPGTWTFAFKSKAALFASLHVTAQATGYDPFSMDFSIPYYWDGPSQRPVTAAVVKDDLTDAGMLAFFKSIGGGPTTLNEIVLTHQRAKRLWKERSEQLKGAGLVIPNGDDVKVAYWLLATMRKLVEKQGAVVDDESADAATWLRGMATSENDSDRLFNPKTVSVDEGIALVKFLGARDAYVYNKLVQTLEADLNSSRPETCERIRALNEFIFSFPFDDRTNYDGQFGNSIKVKDNLLVCIRRDIAPKGQIRADIKSDELERAKTETQTARSTLQEAEQADLYSAPRALLKSRIQDMQVLFDMFDKTAAH